MSDYIFCPLCGSPDWKVNNFQRMANQNLTRYECNECHNFIYTNIQVPVNHSIIANVTEAKRFSEMITVPPYYISLWYVGREGPVTNIRNNEDMELLLSFSKIIKFNWYRQEEVIDKINKYLVFS